MASIFHLCNNPLTTNNLPIYGGSTSSQILFDNSDLISIPWVKSARSQCCFWYWGRISMFSWTIHAVIMSVWLLFVWIWSLQNYVLSMLVELVGRDSLFNYPSVVLISDKLIDVVCAVVSPLILSCTYFTADSWLNHRHGCFIRKISIVNYSGTLQG